MKFLLQSREGILTHGRWKLQPRRSRVLSRTLPAATTLVLLACAAGTPSQPLPSSAHRVLFIGNSLTYTNDLPSMVASIASANGTSVGTASATIGGTALVDHLSAGPARALLARGGWTAVVMQQGPTPAGICRDTLVLATRAFAVQIRSAGAVPATMMPWPNSSRRGDFPIVHQSAHDASDAVDGVLLPAGLAWTIAWRSDPTLAFYGDDGFHPSPVGSYLAALVVFEGLTGIDARTLSPVARVGPGSTVLPEATVRLLQRAAHDAFTESTMAAQITAARTPGAATC